MDFIYFLGRFHVLVLHIPISLLLVAALADVLSRSQRFGYLYPALPFLWGAGAVSAVLTVVLGYMHFAEGGFDTVSGDAHRLFGTLLAIASVLLWLVAALWQAVYLRLRTPLMLLVVVLVFVTGHFGGNLTHGESYLFGGAQAAVQPAAEPAEGPDPALVQRLVEAGFSVRAVAQSDPRLIVAASGTDGLTEAQLALLAEHGPQIVDLSLPRAGLDDADVSRFASSLGQVAHLRLDNNALGDAGIASLAGLDALEALNLYGNPGVTDASVETLADLASLARVYVWGTGMTETGREALSRLRPDLEVHAGTSGP